MPSRDVDRAGTPLGVFGTELRFYRTEAGLSQADLAAKVYASHDVISKIETGDRPPAEDLVPLLDAVPELDTRKALTRIWKQLRKSLKYRAYPGWFDWPDKEATAKTLRSYELATVPGLLQTEAYARAMLADRIGSSNGDADEIVAARMERQTILDRDTPPELWVVIDEAVLHRPVGGRHVMHEQLNHLIEMARRPDIVIQVIPADVGVHEGLRGAGFIIADFDNAPSAAYQDAALRGQTIEAADDVAALMAIWDRLRAEALPRSASLKLIEEVAKTWT
jgi:transcriptional regulator with XRE-family HTH domain